MHRYAILVLFLIAAQSEASSLQTRGRLPLTEFTTAQGLANDTVTEILTDSRGFLWMATLDGVSRFDGERFVNYTTEDGIPHRMVWSIDEDRTGTIWIGTISGAAVLKPSAVRGRGLFERVKPAPGIKEDAAEVHVDRSGRVWAQCELELCRGVNGRLVIDESFRKAEGKAIHSIADSPTGELWVGTEWGLFRRKLDGSWRRYWMEPHRNADVVGGLMVDPAGRVWIGTGFGVLIFAPPDRDDDDYRTLAERAGTPLNPGDALRLPEPGEVVSIKVPGPSPIYRFSTPFRGRDGTVWIPSFLGLMRVRGSEISYLDGNDGLPPIEIMSAGEDRSGDVWIGTRGAGVLRLAQGGPLTFTRAHGMANERVMSLFQLSDGSVCATDRAGLTCFREGKILHGSLWPSDNRLRGWGWNQLVVQDSEGSVWFPTAEGIVQWPRIRRFEDLARAKPRLWTMRDGLDHDDGFRIWQDSKGVLWVGLSGGGRALARLDREKGRFVPFEASQGWILATPGAFAEDRAGNVWVGMYSGGILRWNGTKFEPVTRGVPEGSVRDLKVDSRGRLWIAATGGLARVDDPTAAAAAINVVPYTKRQGRSTESAYCLAELPDGRIAVGSQRGLDVLDVESGEGIHLAIRDGLASNEISVAMVDDSGGLWLGTVNGLSLLPSIPRPRAAPAPRPLITSILIDGSPATVSELGSLDVEGVRIAYPRHAMSVGFSAPNFHRVPIRFEYRMNGNDVWIDAGEQRSLQFDRLPAGEGVLEIRTVTPRGAASEPSRVAFTSVPAVWKQTWFLVLAAVLVTLLAMLAHRWRVAHLVAMERVRTRVATDLHDDLGSTLSRISLLSEAAKRKAPASTVEPILDEIADSARGLVDALGDSIWSIDPRRDDVGSLMMRVRQFAAPVFEAESIDLEVRTDDQVRNVKLHPEQKRETYLILKEALNNAAKHAKARRVAVMASEEGKWLRIAIRDDGMGFITSKAERQDGGRGLPSMTARAERIGGRVEIRSAPGEGTRIDVEVPLT